MAFRDEFDLIKKISSLVGKPTQKVSLGIGDDAAVARPPRSNLVATVDMQVEGVHFDMGYGRAREIGHKALAVNLSDIAAMGAVPLYALVSLALTDRWDESFVEELYRGLLALAARHEVDVIGGNITRTSGAACVDITVVGEVEHACRRDGARLGDVLAVTGQLGGAAAGLAALRALGREACDRFPDAARRQLAPEPRIEAGRLLGQARIPTALIDISDGLCSELHHLAAASRVGVTIDEGVVPVDPAAREVAKELGGDPLAWALAGGEDYELLVALPRERLKDCPVPLFPIGEITASGGVTLRRSDGSLAPLPRDGWNHFATVSSTTR